MAKYKIGDRLTYGKTKLVVVKGHCNSCYFSALNPYGCQAKFVEGCASTLGFDLIFIPERKGV